MVKFRIVESGFNPVLYEMYIGNDRIGTIHLGTDTDATDSSFVHINIDPYYFESKYRIKEVTLNRGRLYIQLAKGDE